MIGRVVCIKRNGATVKYKLPIIQKAHDYVHALYNEFNTPVFKNYSKDIFLRNNKVMYFKFFKGDQHIKVWLEKEK